VFGNPDQEENTYYKYILLLLYSIVIITHIYKYGLDIHHVVSGYLPWLLVFLSLISVFWSISPSLSFRRALAVFFTTAYGYFLYRRMPVTKFIQLLGVLLFIIIALSNLLALVLPDFGIMTDSNIGAWKGVFAQKN